MPDPLSPRDEAIECAWRRLDAAGRTIGPAEAASIGVDAALGVLTTPEPPHGIGRPPGTGPDGNQRRLEQPTTPEPPEDAPGVYVRDTPGEPLRRIGEVYEVAAMMRGVASLPTRDHEPLRCWACGAERAGWDSMNRPVCADHVQHERELSTHDQEQQT